MALPADFNKIYGSTATGGLTPISDVNYAKGWEFVGANPPTKNDFSYLQNLSDLKSQWLYSNKLQRTDPFGDIKSDGAVHTALENLGLGKGSALPVGVPVPWPSATPPTGWIKCNGAPFSAEEYPELAKVYPTLKLPDLRGEFIRGWDDGRGVDASRSIMSQQQGSLMSISFSIDTTDDRIPVIHVYDPPRDYDALISGVGMDSMAGYHKAFDISSVASTLSTPDLTSPLGMTVAGQFAAGGVSRPRNIAFNYIVRAA